MIDVDSLTEDEALRLAERQERAREAAWRRRQVEAQEQRNRVIAEMQRSKRQARLENLQQNIGVLERVESLLVEGVGALGDDRSSAARRNDIQLLLNTVRGVGSTGGHDLGDALQAAGMDRDSLGRPGYSLEKARRELAKLEDS